MKLTVEIDGEQVPLADCDWVKRSPCGCIQAVVVTVMASQTLATEADAWAYFYRDAHPLKTEREKRIRKDQEAGWRLEVIDRSNAVIEFVKPCTHGTTE